MDVLIKGMDIPEHCRDCKLCEKRVIAGFNYFSCKPLQKAASCSGKRDDCPLVEIPSLKEVNDE